MSICEKGYIWEGHRFNGDILGLCELFCHEPNVFFLDSSQHDPHRGRYSFIGFDPFEKFSHRGKDALKLLKDKYVKYYCANQSAFTSQFSPLTAGIVGCLAYDHGLAQEKISTKDKINSGLPDCYFAFYDCILTIDHFTQKLYITSSGLPEKEKHLRKKRAQSRLSYISGRLKPFLNQAFHEEQLPVSTPSSSELTLKCDVSKEQYMNAARRAMEYISNGDIYQVNLSQRFQTNLNGIEINPFQLFKTLRNISPSPFGAYLDCGEFQLISNSPERFLQLKDGIVQSRPMKGTRPRGKSELQDHQWRNEILHSTKEKAELLMITDLMRNDLGRVCDYGSISVKEMRTLEEYNYVFQATSTIEGSLRKDKDCFDLINACFPGGSITGCPKIRAMEIIEELEPVRRGMYTGSLGYINFNGDMDFNILIRTLLVQNENLSFHVGGGIVADSTPENEYHETLVKARALKECIEKYVIHKDQFVKDNKKMPV